MKHYLFSIAMLSSSFITHAQSNWSIGLRTGMELAKTASLNEKTTQPLFQQQLFISKRILNQVELEFNATYKAPIKNSSLTTPGQINDGPDYWIESSTINILEFGFSGRYFIFQKNGWAPYILGGINSTKWVNRFNGYSSSYIGWGGSYPAKYYSDKYSEFTLISQVSFGLGINKAIADHWKLNTQISMSYDLNSPIETYFFLNDYSPKIQIGLAYCW